MSVIEGKAKDISAKSSTKRRKTDGILPVNPSQMVSIREAVFQTSSIFLFV